jgi:subtilisin family serine protease
MGDLILTIPNNPGGNNAVEHLRSRAGPEFGCEYAGSLSSALEGFKASQYLEFLPFTFHLIRTEEGKEVGAINRILQWHSGKTVDYPHGQVEGVDFNFPLYPLARLGLPFQLGGNHDAYLRLMGVDDAHQNHVTGSGLNVAILDTGLDPKSRLTVKDFFDLENTNNMHPGPSSAVDNDGHGTAMAELVNAVAPDAQIWMIRVLDSGGLNLWKLLAGIGIAVADCDADIVNLSLGFSSLALKCAGCGVDIAVRALAFEKLAETATPGTAKVPIYVAATGNSFSATMFDFPASSEKCIAVGSVDSQRQRSSFSNFGINHSRYLMAFGGRERTSGQVSEYVGMGSNTNRCAGSSVAAAYVSGMLALFRSESRYALLGRDNFITSVLANHCALPTAARSNPIEYGCGIIKYSRPSGSLVGTVSDIASQRITSDGEFVYIGSIRLPIRKP